MKDKLINAAEGIAKSVSLPNPIFPIACIGSSAGGIEALTDFFGNLKVDTGIAYIIIQHLDPTIESQLTNIVSKFTQISVIKATDKQEIEPNNVYIIPNGKNVTILNGILKFPEKTEGLQQISIDSFMRSLATDRGSQAIGIILSGVGSDGAMGLKEIKACGGITFSQDLKSAKYDGMPKNALSTGCVDFVLHPSEIPQKLTEIINHAYLQKVNDEKDNSFLTEEMEQLPAIFASLQEYSGIDFTGYRRSTIRRRLMRRLAVTRLDSLETYVKYIEKYKSEIEELYQDLLIGVTSFFRDSASYEVLFQTVFPEIFAHRLGEEPVRIWVPGCSSGEEVYSILICLIEYMKQNNIYASIQAFGTDINDFALDKARKGLYVGNISLDVSTERLKNFFQQVGSRYQIKKNLRNLCVFAKQELINDPPFSRIDLISCRNVLIYLNPELQKKVIQNLHYALQPKGILTLGSSEGINDLANLFRPLDKKHKVYSRLNTSLSPNFQLALLPTEKKDLVTPHKINKQTSFPKWQGQSDQLLLSKYAPAAVIVDENLEIVQFKGQHNPFLCMPEGRASLNLLKMTKEGLAVEIRKIMQEVKQNLHTAKKDHILVKCEQEVKVLNLEVIPLLDSPNKALYFLITFFDASEFQREVIAAVEGKELGESLSTPSSDEDCKECLKKSVMFNGIKHNLQATLENYEFVNKELKAANDEIISTNEELRILNEEFVTAREELQSSNEELTTVNEELQDRMNELNIVNEEFSSLFWCINIPIVVVDLDLSITHLTASAAKVLSLSVNDVGRAINTLKLNIDIPPLKEIINEIIEDKKNIQIKVQDNKSNYYSMNVSLYRKTSKRIEGFIIDFSLLEV